MAQARQITQQLPIANGHTKKPAQDKSLSEKTDYSRWRLLDESGRHTWHYLTDDSEVEKWPQSTADKYHLGLPTVRSPGPQYWSCSNIVRVSQIYHGPQNPHNQYTIVFHFSRICSCHQVNGVANMVVPSSSSLVSSSHGMSPAHQFRQRMLRRSNHTSSQDRTKMMVGGDYTSREKARCSVLR